ncbi:hypothetical protein H0H87_006567 [Tephrocybe sp. NHM501043]|nr:hypothetical protein H0H87_006567 [Tephrocybe sp. NHM501043]
MALSKHVNPEHLLRQSHDKKSHFHGLTKANLETINHTYGARYGTTPVPKYKIASKGLDAASTYQIIHDELSLGWSSRVVWV